MNEIEYSYESFNKGRGEKSLKNFYVRTFKGILLNGSFFRYYPRVKKSPRLSPRSLSRQHHSYRTGNFSKRACKRADRPDRRDSAEGAAVALIIGTILLVTTVGQRAASIDEADIRSSSRSAASRRGRLRRCNVPTRKFFPLRKRLVADFFADGPCAPGPIV